MLKLRQTRVNYMSVSSLNMTDSMKNPGIPQSIYTKQGISNEAKAIIGSTKEKQESKLIQNEISSKISDKLSKIVKAKSTSI